MASITAQDTLTVLVTKHLILRWFQINLILQLVVNKNNPVLVATDTVCGASCHGLGAYVSLFIYRRQLSHSS